MKKSILSLISEETKGKCYTSFKYCYDSNAVPTIAYDDKIGDKISLNSFGENNHSPDMRDISKLAESLIKNQTTPLFRYFLDGSRKVYKVDDIEFGNNKVYPIIAGQVSVACCERESSSIFRSRLLENYLVISLPDISNADGHNNDLYFNSLTEKINKTQILSRYNKRVERVIPYSTNVSDSETLENKGIAKIQDEMVECEKKIVAFLTNEKLLSQDAYLIKDGTLQYKPMRTGDFREMSKIRNNYRCVVGISKSFNPELMLDKRGKSNAGTIANLKLYHRTPAFMYEPKGQFGDGKFAIWYVRIRDNQYTDNRFSGILKIEKMLMSGDESENGLSSEEIDLITANVINERTPVCYGNDNRWGNHLYPIYLTEKFCKSQFISDMFFLNLF